MPGTPKQSLGVLLLQLHTRPVLALPLKAAAEAGFVHQVLPPLPWGYPCCWSMNAMGVGNASGAPS